MNYQWFPGHMTKAFRSMEEDIKLVDLVIEILDARIPISSRNPDINKLAKGKARLLLLNKSDLADKNETKKWQKYYEANGLNCLILDSKNNIGYKELKNAVLLACNDKIEKNKKKGIINRPLRAMVCGIPNVGKSTFINVYSKKASTKTGNKPGVTKGKQWIRLDKNLELLDTPGVLWPRFDDQKTGLYIAMIGSINDEILNEIDLALEIISFMKAHYPDSFVKRYDDFGDLGDTDILNKIAEKKGCLCKGGELDLSKASKLIIEDFRSGKLGGITLERTV